MVFLCAILNTYSHLGLLKSVGLEQCNSLGLFHHFPPFMDLVVFPMWVMCITLLLHPFCSRCSEWCIYSSLPPLKYCLILNSFS